MTKLVTFIFLGGALVFLVSCSNLRTDKVPTKEASKPIAKNIEAPVKPVLKGPTALWYLITHDRVTLYFKNLDNNTAISFIIEKGVTRLPITPGHWELTGFEEGDHSYASMNTSKKFVFRSRSKATTYAGSIVIGCPKVGTEEFKFLKSMRFFNRYPFSSDVGLCEMIVGNDFAMVRSELKKAPETKKLNLVIGF